jgi:integrase
VHIQAGTNLLVLSKTVGHASVEMIRRYVESLSIDAIRREARHTFAATTESVGAKVSDIQHRLGHASLATSGRYLAGQKSAVNMHADTVAALYGVE